MCVIIVKPVGKVIPEEILKRSCTLNKDGYGFCAWEEKNPMNLFYTLNADEFLAKVAEFNNEKSLLIMHCRLSTGGGVSLQNCHPFHMMKNDLYLFHNGTIKGFSIGCDTLYFTEFLDKYADNIEEIKAIEDFFAAFNESRLVVCNRAGDYVILNENVGKWKDGIWYSKENVLSSTHSIGSGYYGYSKYGDWGNYRSSVGTQTTMDYSKYGIFTNRLLITGLHFPDMEKWLEELPSYKYWGSATILRNTSVNIAGSDGLDYPFWANKLDLGTKVIWGGSINGILLTNVDLKDINDLASRANKYYDEMGYTSKIEIKDVYVRINNDEISVKTLFVTERLGGHGYKNKIMVVGYHRLESKNFEKVKKILYAGCTTAKK